MSRTTYMRSLLWIVLLSMAGGNPDLSDGSILPCLFFADSRLLGLPHRRLPRRQHVGQIMALAEVSTTAIVHSENGYAPLNYEKPVARNRDRLDG